MEKYLYITNHYFSQRSIYSNGGKSLQVKCPWDMIKNSFLRFLCHLHYSSKLNRFFILPFHSLWNNLILGNYFDNCDNQILIINSHFYLLISGKLVEKFKKKYPKGKVFFIFSDKVDTFFRLYKNFPSIDSLKKIFNFVITYNVNDANIFNLILSRPYFLDYSFVPEISCEESDVFYVGKSKERLNSLLQIFDICSRNKLKCLFYINGVDESYSKKYPDIHFNEKLSYEKVIACVKKTHAVVNIVQKDGEGMTLRDYEASYFGKFLITNNNCDFRNSFFADGQVVLLNEIEEKAEAIKSLSFKNDIIKDYSIEKWYEWIDSL